MRLFLSGNARNVFINVHGIHVGMSFYPGVAARILLGIAIVLYEGMLMVFIWEHAYCIRAMLVEYSIKDMLIRGYRGSVHIPIWGLLFKYF